MSNPFASPFGKAFDSFNLTDVIGEYEPTLPPLSDEIVVGKGGAIPWNTATITGYTRAESRTELIIGDKDCDEIYIEYWNGYLANGEQSNTNNVTYESFLEGIDVATGTVVRGLFSGSNTASCAGGAYVRAGPILASSFGLSVFPAGSHWRVQTGAVPAAGLKVCITISNNTANLASERFGVLSSTGSSNLGSAGDLTVPGGGIESNNVCTPTMITGKFRGSAPMVIYQVGDSVDMGQNDTSDTGVGNTGGWFAIGTRTASVGQIAMTRAARSGEQVRYYANATNTYRKRMMTFHNYICTGFGGADGLAGRTYAQVTADVTTLYTDAKARLQSPCKVIQRLIQPYTSSTDSWATPTNQTAGSGGEIGGSRDQINAYFNAQLGGNVDYVFNPNTWWQNQTTSPDYHWCWANGRCADGSHPNGTGHHEAGAGFATFIDNIYNEAPASYPLSASLAGAGTMTAYLRAQRKIAATMSGAATMTAAIGKIAAGGISATLTGSGSMTAAIKASRPIASALAGSGAMTAAILARRPLAAAMSGAATMTSAIKATKPIAASMSGAGSMTAAIGFSSGSFEPSSLSGYLVWLDAGSYVTHSSNVITAWDDKYAGSSTYGATQSGTSTLRPTLSTFNGIPIVNLDGGDYLQWNLPSGLHASGNAFTIVIVYRKTNLGIGNQYVYGYNDIETGYYGGMGVGNDGSHKWSVGGNGSQTSLVAGGGNSNLHFITTRCTVGGQIRGSLDGGTEQVGTGNFGAVAATENFQLGRESKTPGSYFTGGIVGALAFSSYLSSTDLNTLCNYLETYYNPTSGDAVWSDVS